jgi:hypothetical protein
MSTDPWTSNDPAPGGFDSTLESIDAAFVEHRDGYPQSSIRIVLSAEPWWAFERPRPE